MARLDNPGLSPGTIDSTTVGFNAVKAEDLLMAEAENLVAMGYAVEEGSYGLAGEVYSAIKWVFPLS